MAIWLLMLLTARAAQEGDFTYEDNGTGIAVTKYTGAGGAVAIPDSIAGKRVTSIGDSVFRSHESLTSVSIPDSVTSIGQGAFYYCTGLSSLVIGNGVTSIGEGAFMGCVGLTSVVIPNSVTSLGADSFAYCTGLLTASIGNGITSISDSAFYYCPSLASVTIPDSVTSIGEASFYGCAGLTNIIIPSSVTKIRDRAFSSCTGLTAITIPNSVTSIGNASFYGCSGLTNIVIPNTVTSIGVAAFQECTSLTSVIIPDSVTLIGSQAFARCSRLTSIAIPKTVVSIGDRTFQYCPSLANVTIPDSVTAIGVAAFQECTNLSSVIVPNGVNSIGESAFRGCSGLTSLTISSSVTSIGDSAFFACTGLASVSIPEGVDSIGEGAFYACSRLTSFTVDPLNPAYSSLQGVLFSKNQTNLIAFPAGKMGSYTIPDSVSSIGNGAFFASTGLSSVTIASRVTRIGVVAFSGTGLTSLYFLGNAPSFSGGSQTFLSSEHATIFYRAGTTGWKENIEGRPAVLSVATDDLDKDGANNLEEMLAGTDPLDAGDTPLSITAEKAEYRVQLRARGNLVIPDGVATATVLTGMYLYVSTAAPGGEAEYIPAIHVIDISNAENPALAGTLRLKDGRDSEYPTELKVEGNALYSMAPERLTIIDITDPKAPKLTSQWSPPNQERIQHIAAKGNFIYVLADYVLRILDVTNQAAPSPIGEWRLELWNYGPLEIWGSHAFVMGEGLLRIIDVSNPATPRLAASYSRDPEATPQFPMVFWRGFAFIVSRYDTADWRIDVLDMNDPVQPVFVTSLPFNDGSTIRSMQVVGDQLYIRRHESHMPGEYDFLGVVNIGDPRRPFLVGEFGSIGEGALPSFHGMAVNNQSVFLSYGSRIHVYQPLFIPLLGIKNRGNQIELNWPNVDPGFQPQRNSDAAAWSAWRNVQATPRSIDGQNYATIPKDVKAEIFRLEKRSLLNSGETPIGEEVP